MDKEKIRSKKEEVRLLPQAASRLFTPLERRRLLSAVKIEIADGSVMLPSAGREAPVLTGFTFYFGAHAPGFHPVRSPR